MSDSAALSFAYAATCLAFVLSASAGFGGSLILVPAFTLLFGVKQGIALASLLLAANNIGKLVVYFHSVPFRATALALLLTVAGTSVGAHLLVNAPEEGVRAAVMVTLIGSFVIERLDWTRVSKRLSPLMLLAAGITSGFSGTSGPLKGTGLRAMGLTQLPFLGAASLIGCVSDVTKTTVFSRASLLDERNLWFALAVLPVIPLAALLGRRLNRSMGQRLFTGLFWSVMAGYVVRLAV